MKAARQLHWHEIRRRRKSEGGQKFLPPNPLPPHQNKFGTGLRFLPARAIGFQNSQSGFSSKKVRTSPKKHRQKIWSDEAF